jgi:hypothetical protein
MKEFSWTARETVHTVYARADPSVREQWINPIRASYRVEKPVPEARVPVLEDFLAIGCTPSNPVVRSVCTGNVRPVSVYDPWGVYGHISRLERLKFAACAANRVRLVYTVQRDGEAWHAFMKAAARESFRAILGEFRHVFSSLFVRQFDSVQEAFQEKFMPESVVNYYHRIRRLERHMLIVEEDKVPKPADLKEIWVNGLLPYIKRELTHADFEVRSVTWRKLLRRAIKAENDRKNDLLQEKLEGVVNPYAREFALAKYCQSTHDCVRHVPIGISPTTIIGASSAPTTANLNSTIVDSMPAGQYRRATRPPWPSTTPPAKRVRFGGENRTDRSLLSVIAPVANGGANVNASTQPASIPAGPTRDLSRLTCFNCLQMGHPRSLCSNAAAEGVEATERRNALIADIKQRQQNRLRKVRVNQNISSQPQSMLRNIQNAAASVGNLSHGSSTTGSRAILNEIQRRTLIDNVNDRRVSHFRVAATAGATNSSMLHEALAVAAPVSAITAGSIITASTDSAPSSATAGVTTASSVVSNGALPSSTILPIVNTVGARTTSIVKAQPAMTDLCLFAPRYMVDVLINGRTHTEVQLDNGCELQALISTGALNACGMCMADVQPCAGQCRAFDVLEHAVPLLGAIEFTARFNGIDCDFQLRAGVMESDLHRFYLGSGFNHLFQMSVRPINATTVLLWVENATKPTYAVVRAEFGLVDADVVINQMKVRPGQLMREVRFRSTGQNGNEPIMTVQERYTPQQSALALQRHAAKQTAFVRLFAENLIQRADNNYYAVATVDDAANAKRRENLLKQEEYNVACIGLGESPEPDEYWSAYLRTKTAIPGDGIVALVDGVIMFADDFRENLMPITEPNGRSKYVAIFLPLLTEVAQRVVKALRQFDLSLVVVITRNSVAGALASFRPFTSNRTSRAEGADPIFSKMGRNVELSERWLWIKNTRRDFDPKEAELYDYRVGDILFQPQTADGLPEGLLCQFDVERQTVIRSVRNRVAMFVARGPFCASSRVGETIRQLQQLRGESICTLMEMDASVIPLVTEVNTPVYYNEGVVSVQSEGTATTEIPNPFNKGVEMKTEVVPCGSASGPTANIVVFPRQSICEVDNEMEEEEISQFHEQLSKPAVCARLHSQAAVVIPSSSQMVIPCNIRGVSARE